MGKKNKRTIGFILLLLAIISFPVYGFVLVKLWHWFIVPIFQMNELRLVDAMGILLVVIFLRNKQKDSDSLEGDFYDRIGKILAHLIVFPLLVLLFGWILTLFY